MKTLSKIVTAVFAVGAFIAPSLVHAQDLTLRLEPGVALPVGQPQSDRFNVGFDGMVKLDVPLVSVLDVVPSVGVLALPHSSSFDKTGSAWMAGGGLRLHRPHDLQGNPQSGLAAVAPWMDFDVQYVRTGDLNRLGWTAGLGASVPTSDSRWLWVGPFARLQVVGDPDKAGFDTTASKTAVLGVSFEFGPSHKKPVLTMPKPPVVALPPPPPVVAAPPPVVVEEEAMHVVVQFKVDSFALDSTARLRLDAVVAKVQAGVKVSAIEVEGHASSDGPLAHNNVLAKQRAEAVANYLASKGLDRSKMTVTGYGITKPVRSNKTLSGRVANRRSEVNLTVTVKVAK